MGEYNSSDSLSIILEGMLHRGNIIKHGRVGGGREVQEGRDICIPMANSL